MELKTWQKILFVPLMILGVGLLCLLLFSSVYSGWYISPLIFSIILTITLSLIFYRFFISKIELNFIQNVLMSLLLFTHVTFLSFYILLIYGLLLVTLHPDIYHSDSLGFWIILISSPLAILATYRSVQISLGEYFSYKWFFASLILYTLIMLVFNPGSSGSHRFSMFSGTHIFELIEVAYHTIVFGSVIILQILFIWWIKKSSAFSTDKYLTLLKNYQ